MRSYLGERDTFGRPIVWVIDKPEEPGAAEVAALAADLRAHVVDGRPVDVVELMARKHELLDRIEAAKHRSQELLEHYQIHSPDGFEWGYAGNGPADLAHAILTNYLGTQPPDLIRFEFRDQIVAGQPRDRFLLRADQIDVWVQANQRLFREHWAAQENGQAWSVAEPATAGSLDETSLTVDPATASTLVAACEGAWADIQAHHPELPEAVMVLGTGIERGRLVKLGHWWEGQWVADGQARGEVLLAGEALHLQPSQVFEVLLHEAAHGINAARGIKDTSRGGRYHNKHFASTARQVLLRVRPMPPYGLAQTELTTAALDRYGPTIERLGDAMRIARKLHAGVQISGEVEGTPEGGTKEGKDTTDGQPKTGQNSASCGCGRKMRMAPKTLAAGPVVCGVCGTEFTNGAERKPTSPNQTTERTDQAPTGRRDAEGQSNEVIDRTFLTRREAALAAEPDPTTATSDHGGGVLERQRARLEAVLAAEPSSVEEGLRALTERRDRLERVLRETLGTGPGVAVVEASAAQVSGAADIAPSEHPGADGSVLRRWYQRYGTDDEQPIPAVTASDTARRERLARALLKADGTLNGPAVTTPAGTELQAGDRVLAASDHDDLPAGTPGTIERVDADTGTVEIDFATWGRLQTNITEGLARDLRHDYTEIPTSDLEPAGIEL